MCNPSDTEGFLSDPSLHCFTAEQLHLKVAWYSTGNTTVSSLHVFHVTSQPRNACYSVEISSLICLNEDLWHPTHHSMSIIICYVLSSKRDSLIASSNKRPFVPRSCADIQLGDVIKFSRQGGKISKGEVKYTGRLPGKTDMYLGLELENESKLIQSTRSVCTFACRCSLLNC